MIKVKMLKDLRLAIDGKGYVIKEVKKGDEVEVSPRCYYSLIDKCFEAVPQEAKEAPVFKSIEDLQENTDKSLKKRVTKILKKKSKKVVENVENK